LIHLRKILTWILLIVIVFSPHIGSSVYAESNSKSVKECMEHPEKCKEEVGNEKNELEKSETINSETVTTWDFFKMIFSFIFVIALLYLLLRFINKRSRLFQKYRYLENLGGTSLGTNRSIQLVKVGNRILVVGVGDSIQLLKEIDDEEEIKEILEEHNARLDQLLHSNEWLKKWISNKNSEQQSDQPFASIFKQQLQEFAKGRKKLLEEIEKKGSDR
jgi:flagellar protein FliO/FliZ